VVHPSGQVLVLARPSRREVRLPKGHLDPGETPQQTARREIDEEAGFRGLKLLADLGQQEVEFDYQGRHYQREERYFLFLREGAQTPDHPPEPQFRPLWLSWEEAAQQLTYAAEREWLRRARQAWQDAFPLA